MSLVERNVRRVNVYNRRSQNKLDCRESSKVSNMKMYKSRKYKGKV